MSTPRISHGSGIGLTFKVRVAGTKRNSSGSPPIIIVADANTEIERRHCARMRVDMYNSPKRVCSSISVVTGRTSARRAGPIRGDVTRTRLWGPGVWLDVHD